MPQLHAAAGRLSPGALAQWGGQWETVYHSLVSALPRRSPCPPRRLCSGPRPGGGCRCSAALFGLGTPGLLPARFGLVVWIGVLEVRGWFPIQLQHGLGVQSPNHQSKPAIGGKLRRVPQKGRALQAVVGIPRTEQIL